jgi:DNA-directed RNA polymerase specialized sigma24 family protein
MPTEKPTDSLDQALAAIDWGDLHERLYLYARKRAKDPDDAQDLVQDAIASLKSGEPCAWDRVKQPNVAYHLVRVIDTLHKARRRAKERRADPAWVDKARIATTRPLPRPDEALAERQRVERGYALWARLREGLERDGDRTAIAVLDQYEQRVTGAREQAAAIGASDQAVYQARQKIARRAEALRAAAGGADDDAHDGGGHEYTGTEDATDPEEGQDEEVGT